MRTSNPGASNGYAFDDIAIFSGTHEGHLSWCILTFSPPANSSAVPKCATPLHPLPEVNDVSPFLTKFQWLPIDDTIDLPAGYRIWIGTDSPPTNIRKWNRCWVIHILLLGFNETVQHHVLLEGCTLWNSITSCELPRVEIHYLEL